MLVCLVVGGLVSVALVLARAGDDGPWDLTSDSAPVRWIPEDAPAGLTLIWVDDHPEVAVPAAVKEWDFHRSDPAYAFGFHDARAELPPVGHGRTGQLSVEIFPGYSLRTDAVAADFDDPMVEEEGIVFEVRQDSVGRPAATYAYEHPVRTRIAMFQLEETVARVIAESPTETNFDALDAFVHSFRLTDEAGWRAEIAGADVAPPYGTQDPVVTLVEGQGWRLDEYDYRSRRMVGRTVADLIIDGKTAPTDPAAEDYGAFTLIKDSGTYDFVELRLDDVPGGVVAWGIAPRSVTAIRFDVSDTTTDVTTLAFGNDRIFAVQLPQPPSSATTFDADGRELDVPIPLLGEHD